MIDPLRAEILELMAKLIERRPNIRVGQMICNAELYMEDGIEQSVGNLDDERLANALRRQLRGSGVQTAATPSQVA